MTTVSENVDRLHNARDKMFKRTKRRWSTSVFLGALIPMLAIWSTVSKDDSTVITLGIVTLVFSIAAFFLRESAQKYSNAADKLRRSVMYADSLGLAIREESLLEIDEDIANSCLSGDPSLYYASTANIGPGRLNENLKESAYFTWKLGNLMGAIVKGISMLVLVAAIVLLYVAATYSESTETTWLPTLARVIALLLALIVAGDFASLGNRYSGLGIAAERVYRRTARMSRSNSFSERDVLLSSEEYSVAVVQAPPIPEFVFGWRRNRLNAAYARAIRSDADDSS